MSKDPAPETETEIDDTAGEIRATLNFITGWIEFYQQRGISDEETLNAFAEMLAECRRLDGMIRERWRPEAVAEWEQVMAYVQEKEQQVRDTESSRETNG
jgi:hypothetical protein